MKKYIIILGIVALVIGNIAFAATVLVKVKTTSYVMDIEALPANTVKKFIDGTNVCYVYQQYGGISCLKK